ncbi:hypothetical protein CY652_05030 [Burkholderia sp. WAC0059]|nr:hypothetical protein CY652_05030 [Burkholderia sp. WAC0059]
MAILAHSLKLIFRLLLLIGIYAVTLRFVHTYPLEMPPNQQKILFILSDKLGIRDPDNLYIYGFAVFDLIIAIILYMLITNLWRRCRAKRLDPPTHE